MLIADHSNIVVVTYAAAAIERMLIIRDNGVPRFTKEFVQQFAGQLLANLFKLLQVNNENCQENEYLMKGK